MARAAEPGKPALHKGRRLQANNIELITCIGAEQARPACPNTAPDMSAAGLAIMRSLTDLLDHALKVRSTSERGSAFLLEMSWSDAEISATPPVGQESGEMLTPGLILVVVDDEQFQARPLDQSRT